MNDIFPQDLIHKGEHSQIVHYENHGEPAALAVHSDEHLLPLHYVLGAGQKDDIVAHFSEKEIMGLIPLR